MTPAEQTLRIALERATSGPWEVAYEDVGDRYEVKLWLLVGPEDEVMHLSGGFGHPSKEDVEFIVAARNTLPELLEELDKYRKNPMWNVRGGPEPFPIFPEEDLA